MKQQAISCHAGCPVCDAAEQQLAEAIDSARFDVEIVHLGESKSRIGEAESIGVTSVPALSSPDSRFTSTSAPPSPI